MQIVYIETQHIRKAKVTICQVGAYIDGQYRLFEGVAKCHPTDKFSPKVGAALAEARALQSVASARARWANGYMKHIEDIQLMEHNSPPQAVRMVPRPQRVIPGVNA